MRPRSIVPTRVISAYTRSGFRSQWTARRCLTTLAIETSCDDTSVAILEKNTHHGCTSAQLHFHKKVTSDNKAFQGVHPLVSLQSHQDNLASLVNEAIQHLPPKDGNHHESSGMATKRLPDFISVTRGPGMRANLFTGLDTAKGLAVAWQIPIVGVHHMQAHALTPRMVDALGRKEIPSSYPNEPSFPFLSVLASGGHTLLIQSNSLVDHHVLGSTGDIAIGEYLDKAARVLLPSKYLETSKSTMYGALLEQFAFTNHETEHSQQGRSTDTSSFHPISGSSSVGRTAQNHVNNLEHLYSWYEAPSNHEKAAANSRTRWGWQLTTPLIKSSGGIKIKDIALSFSGLLTAVERVVRFKTDPATNKMTKFERAADDVSLEERRDIAREAMRISFEHLAYRVILSLQSVDGPSATPTAVVLAGGVASNLFLRYILAKTLCARGYSDIKLYFPPPKFCTDNAAMIAWAGLEMFEAGHMDSLSIRAIRKWPLDRLLQPPEDS